MVGLARTTSIDEPLVKEAGDEALDGITRLVPATLRRPVAVLAGI